MIVKCASEFDMILQMDVLKSVLLPIFHYSGFVFKAESTENCIEQKQPI